MCWGTTSSEVDKQGWDSRISFNNDDRAVSRICLRRQSLIGLGDRHIVVDDDFDNIRECFKFEPHKNCLLLIYETYDASKFRHFLSEFPQIDHLNLNLKRSVERIPRFRCYLLQ